MRSKAIDFPHPVLSASTKDFNDNRFLMELVSQDDSTREIVFVVNCKLYGDGLKSMLNNDLLQGIVRVSCAKTSYREIFPVKIDEPSEIRVHKDLVSGSMEMQALILAKDNDTTYKLEDFNKDYFGEMVFHLRKGDVVASEPGIQIKLNTVLEQETAGIVKVSEDKSISEMKVNYATTSEEDPSLSDYIVIRLPENEYAVYAKMRKKKYLKNGIERYLQASLILPAVVEGIALLRREDELDPDDQDQDKYTGTIWADSLREALKNKLSITDLSEQLLMSDYEIANKILGNVEFDSMNNLMQKMIDWSTIRQEEDIL